jgi:ribonuclease VapC
MVIDTSAILAVLLFEPEAQEIARLMRQSRKRLAPASVILEASIVLLARHGEMGWRMLDEFRQSAAIETISFDEGQALAARDAFRRFGKGRHPAGLNFGDCMSYALAKTEMMPLLFKGDDFRLTDVEAHF